MFNTDSVQFVIVYIDIECELRIRRRIVDLIAQSEHERPDNCRQDDGDRHHQDNPDDGRDGAVVVGLK